MFDRYQQFIHMPTNLDLFPIKEKISISEILKEKKIRLLEWM